MRFTAFLLKTIFTSGVLYLLLLAICCSACSKGAPKPLPLITHTVSYAPGYMFLEVEAKGTGVMSELTLTYDRVVRAQDYVDACVNVVCKGTGVVTTWAAIPMGDKCLLVYTGTNPLPQGTYVFPVQYYVRRSVLVQADGRSDVDTTPQVLSVQVSG